MIFTKNVLITFVAIVQKFVNTNAYNSNIEVGIL